MEKLNRKPFKLKGFDNNIASVSDWDGGAFADLPGDCKASASLRADPKAPRGGGEGPVGGTTNTLPPMPPRGRLSRRSARFSSAISWEFGV
jgi:hypothetical protein